MKVAIYARVSTEDQHAEKQVNAMTEYCKRIHKYYLCFAHFTTQK